jgi:hypothetical protein
MAIIGDALSLLVKVEFLKESENIFFIFWKRGRQKRHLLLFNFGEKRCKLMLDSVGLVPELIEAFLIVIGGYDGRNDDEEKKRKDGEDKAEKEAVQ